MTADEAQFRRLGEQQAPYEQLVMLLNAGASWGDIYLLRFGAWAEQEAILARLRTGDNA